MNVSIYSDPNEANAAAAERLASWLVDKRTRNVMPATGNTPLDLYARLAKKGLDLRHLRVFILDEYVGVPADEPRNCSNLLKERVQEAWGIPPEQFFTISSQANEALESVIEHERRIERAGGLDVVILGLGQNGHLGFNEPGSVEESTARVVDLEPVTVEANRLWFDGVYAPVQGATIGLKTILAGRRIMLMAFGEHKAGAVQAMIDGPLTPSCPASFLQNHRSVEVYLDQKAARRLRR